jgi:hypothetical protein
VMTTLRWEGSKIANTITKKYSARVVIQIVRKMA